ncbi:gag-pol polyprotein, partial [Lasius niger]
APVLTLPQENTELFLYTDASDIGLGATLTQKFSDGKEGVIAYAHRVLKPAEVKYHTTEKECLAVLWACERLKIYLSRTVNVVTDHVALEALQTAKELKGRVARWAIQLQEFPIVIKHRPGPELVVPDALSRDPVPEHTELPDWEPVFLVASCEREELAEGQKTDEWYAKILKFLASGELPNDQNEALAVKGRAKFFKVDQGLLWHKFGGKADWQIAIPRHLIDRVCFEFHDVPSAGHLGIKKTFQRSAAKAYWPGMKKYIQDYVKSCRKCQMHKHDQTPKAGLLMSVEPTCPGEMWGVDLIGPLPTSSRGNMYVLVAVDYYSKWVEIFPLRVANIKIISRHLVRDVFSRFGFPKFMLSDNGPQFIADVYRETCRAFGIKCKYTSPYHPQTNLTEHINRTLGTMISEYVGETHGTCDHIL